MPQKGQTTPKKMAGITVTQRGVRDTARQIKLAMSALHAAARNARKKQSDKSTALLAKQSKKLHREIKDTEVVLQKADRTGLITKSLEEVIDKVREMIRDSDKEVAQRIKDAEAENGSNKGNKRGKGSKNGKRQERRLEGESESGTKKGKEDSEQ